MTTQTMTAPNLDANAVTAPSGISRDTQAMMAFQSQKKSVGAAYVLWFFLGLLGAHRFYLGQTGTAIAQLILSITVIGLIVSAVWVLVDAFLIPGLVEKRIEEIRRVITM